MPRCLSRLVPPASARPCRKEQCGFAYRLRLTRLLRSSKKDARQIDRAAGAAQRAAGALGRAAGRFNPLMPLHDAIMEEYGGNGFPECSRLTPKPNSVEDEKLGKDTFEPRGVKQHEQQYGKICLHQSSEVKL